MALQSLSMSRLWPASFHSFTVRKNVLAIITTEDAKDRHVRQAWSQKFAECLVKGSVSERAIEEVVTSVF